MTLLQATEVTEALQGYNQIPIIAGMFICIIGLYVYEKWIRKTPKLQLSGLEAIEVTNIMEEKLANRKVEFTGAQGIKITTEMINKILQTPVDGHTAEKRISKLHHDVTSAFKNKDDIAGILIQINHGQDRIAEAQDKFITIVAEAYEDQAKSRTEHHKENMKLQEKYLKELIKNK